MAAPETITIEGHQFNVPNKYSEGHRLLANEAHALNQTFHENLRNNFAKFVRDAKEDGELSEEVKESLQSKLDDYAEGYEFFTRGGGPVRDPVRSEAMDIARETIKDQLKLKGIALKNVESSAITEAAVKLIDKNPAIMELAKQNIEKRKAAAHTELDEIMAGITMKPSEEEAEAAE